MFRRRDPEIKIDEHLPESLRWLLDVSPVPNGSDSKCAETGVCRMMNFDGVSCGALKGKCALLPLEYHEIAKEEKKVLEPIKVAFMPTDNKSLAAGDDLDDEWDLDDELDEVAEVLE